MNEYRYIKFSEPGRASMNEAIFRSILDRIDEICENHEPILWEDFNLEMPLLGKRCDYTLILWGEENEAGEKWFGLSFRENEKVDEPGYLDGFYTESRDPEDLKKVLFKGLKMLDRYIETGSAKKPKRKFRKGGHILSIDELARQEFVYWHDKITHYGWFQNWSLNMVAKCVGPSGCIYYAIQEEVQK